MTPKGYSTPEKVAAYLGITLTEALTAKFNTWIASVEVIIDQMTDRNFKADSNATARLYDGDNTNELLIDDCVEITKVEIGQDDYGASFQEVLATGTDRYWTDPANHVARKLPIRKVTLRSQGFLWGKQNQRITAKWGYSATPPADIEFATTVFVAGIYNNSTTGGSGEVKSEKIGNYQVTYDTDSEGGANSWADFKAAQDTVNQYKRLVI